jgi:hypothetical protein
MLGKLTEGSSVHWHVVHDLRLEVVPHRINHAFKLNFEGLLQVLIIQFFDVPQKFLIVDRP